MKKLMTTALAFLAVSLMTSCGNSEDADEFKPSLDRQAECSIKVAGDYDNFEALEAEFDRFNEFYPNVHLSYFKPDDYNNKLATVLSGKDKPNIFFFYTWLKDNEKYASVISHMEDLSDPALKFNLDCIRPGLLSRDAQNRVFMVPIFSRSYGVLVNNNLFKKENLSVPNTWDELLNVCKSFADKGYQNPMMGYSRGDSSCFMNSVAYPIFVAELAKNPDALAKANNLDPTAGEYMRGALQAVDNLIKNKCFNLEECNKIEDNYAKVILRFFEGDVPMMVCHGDTVSGTKKRESQSEAFIKSPFDYSFYPIPVTSQGGYFIDSPSVEFSVNKDCDNLDMTNEFMRFLLTSKELNQMASAKRMVTPTKMMSFDPVYAPFGKVPSERTFSTEVLGIKDPLTVQIRKAAYKVGKGELTIDEAISMYGQL